MRIALSRNSARCSRADEVARRSRGSRRRSSAKVAHRLSTGKLLANMQRCDAEQVDRGAARCRDSPSTVHGTPGWPRPEIFTATFGQRGELRHRAPPAGDALGAAVGRQPGVIEDDLRVGEIGARAAPPRRRCHHGVCRSKRRPLRREPREAGAPRGVGHAAGRGVAGRRVGARLVADAAHERERRLLLEHCARVVAVEPGLRDRDASAGRARGAAARRSASRRPDRADPIRSRRRPSCRR